MRVMATHTLPYRTHYNLLPVICDDLPVEYQLHIRFLKSINLLTAKLFNLNFHPLEVVSR